MLLLWLEPWADEVEVPPRSTVTIAWPAESDPSAPGEFSWTPDHLVLWAAAPTIRVFLDGILQRTASATVPIPAGLTRGMLTVMFENRPEARLAGAPTIGKRHRHWWSALGTLFRRSKA